MQTSPKPGHQRGSSSQGILIWVVVLGLLGMAIKSAFFPSVKGISSAELTSRFGEPLARTAIPKPR